MANASDEADRKARVIALNAVEAALDAADPKKLVKSYVAREGNKLVVHDHVFDLDGFRKVFVIGGGKAGGRMAEAVEEILNERIEDGVVNIPKGTRSFFRVKRIRLVEAGHPLPSEEGMRGAERMVEIAENACERDLVLCLISGGGSALMPLPRGNISLADKLLLTERLLKSGADIREINVVRRHLSSLKGGWLAKKAYPATVVTLVISDVVGDPLEAVASGPTFPDPTTFRDAIAILRKYGLWDETTVNVKEFLEAGAENRIAETPKPGDRAFDKVYNFLVGNNRTACLGGLERLRRDGVNALYLTSYVEGEARQYGLFLSALAKEILSSGHPISKPAAIFAGGETTVKVLGSGRGGRNQETVLSAAMKIEGLAGAVVTSVATDGIDGSTEVAGALADGETVKKAAEMGLNAGSYLNNNDSYSFFSEVGDVILTGPTGTNVGDVAVVVVV